MKTLKIRQKYRFRRPHRAITKSGMTSPLLLSAGYLLGCLIGIGVAIKAESVWLANLLPDPVDKSVPDLLSALCSYGTYGFVMLLLSSSYLGFLLMPSVLFGKGFLTGSYFTVCLRGTAEDRVFLAAAELLPDLFLFPALLVLGQLCMCWSVRLFRCRAGETLPPAAPSAGPLALVLIMLLFAAAVKAYAVPYLLSLS